MEQSEDRNQKTRTKPIDPAMDAVEIYKNLPNTVKIQLKALNYRGV